VEKKVIGDVVACLNSKFGKESPLTTTHGKQGVRIPGHEIRLYDNRESKNLYIQIHQQDAS